MLSSEREALWARLERTTFLTATEKRAAVGYEPIEPAESDPPGQTPLAPLTKYSPTQPRVSSGNSDGGQWTDGGGGGGTPSGGSSPGGSGSDRNIDPSTTGTVESDNPPANPEFSPSKPGWHSYTTKPNPVCGAWARCSHQDMADQFSRFAFPGQDPSKPVKNGEVNLVYDPRLGWPGGNVLTTVSEDGLTITNRTLRGHILFDGQIERTATQASDGSWYVTTRGIGNNVIPGMNIANEWRGPQIFDELDRRLRINIRRHRGNGKSAEPGTSGRTRSDHRSAHSIPHSREIPHDKGQ